MHKHKKLITGTTQQEKTNNNNTLLGFVGTGAASTNLLFIDVGCAGDDLRALLDSGALHNFVCTRILKSMQNKPVTINTNAMQIRLADESLTFSTQLVHLPLCFGTCIQIVTCRVVENLNHGLILGMKWFSKVNPTINWKQK